MTAPAYGREALRRLRERQAQTTEGAERPRSVLDQVPPDAPMEEATLTVWDGQRFVAYDKWRIIMPVIAEEQIEENESGIATAKSADLLQDSPVQKGLWEADADVDLDRR